MSQDVIQVERLTKRYLIRHLQYGTPRYDTLRDRMVWLGKEAGLRLRGKKSQAGATEEFVALDDLSFSLQRGDRLGIIGRNGAGKSTLLKILSRITQPTSGKAVLRGRVASLLEVGTGFHPELTGRENIYLNGAVLGMLRAEIKAKFDSIVDFAGIERFLDTPVKRYSSGMYVRLAFAVAAHLEPDILIVDEVLSVGDAEFQKKSLGKMEEVSRQGRTVLFVSHNMGTILHFCDKGLLLNQGKLEFFGGAKEAVDTYLHMGSEGQRSNYVRTDFHEAKHIVRSIDILDADLEPKQTFAYGEAFVFRVTTNPKYHQGFGIEFRIKSSKQELVAYGSGWMSDAEGGDYAPGDTVLVRIPALKLIEDEYYLDVFFRNRASLTLDYWVDSIKFTVATCHPASSPFALERSRELGSVVLDDIAFRRTARQGI